ncbi:MAG: hypothetical protein OXM01_05685 [Gemmatimonadota bacterium]|nr:hypothetical protein [Gemmatimonadota bacterium]
MNRNEIVREVVEAFRVLEATMKQRGGDTKKEWTRQVLTTLCVLGRREGFTTWASGVANNCRDGGEWLWDCTWTKPDKFDWLDSVPLAAECEWSGLSDVEEDFQKLLVARAAVRVMVYDAGLMGGRVAATTRMREWVGAYRDSEPHDTYLLVGYEYDEEAVTWQFRYSEIVARGHGERPALMHH